MFRLVPCRITVDCEELEGSPTEVIASDLSPDFWTGTGATRVFRCASGDRMLLIREFLGGWYGSIFRLPHSYTDISGLVVATSAATKPVGKMSGLVDNRFANYPKTDVTITYKIPPETFEAYGGLVTVTETMREASEFVTCSTKGLFWYVDGVTNEQTDEFDAPGTINNLTEWTYEIRRARIVPPGVWGHPGKVNLYQAYSRTYDRYFPPETLLCCSPEVTIERTFSGTTYNILLRFLVKNNGTFAIPKGWNHFPRRSIITDTDVTYERMVRAVDAPDSAAGWKVFYPLEDFVDIFIA